MDDTAPAPVAASAGIDVRAPLEVVWGVLAAVDAWPAWNADVRWVRTDGPPAPGSTFRWKSGPGSIRATIVAFEPPRHLALEGRTLGVLATHDWRLESGDAAGTRVRTTEAWRGPLARLLRGPLQARLERRLAERLDNLRGEAERRSGARPA